MGKSAITIQFVTSRFMDECVLEPVVTGLLTTSGYNPTIEDSCVIK